MANTEDALIGLEQILKDDYPTFLQALEKENVDGVRLEQLRSIEWEEIDDRTPVQTPGVILLPDTETDDSLRDIIYESRITAVFLFSDSNKRNVTKKMLRYAKALRRLLRPTNNRSLRARVISAKVGTIRWLPIGRGVGDKTRGLFARGFEADLVIRLPKEGD